MKFFITDFFSKCDQISRNLRIWSHLLKKSIMENFISCAVYNQSIKVQVTTNNNIKKRRQALREIPNPWGIMCRWWFSNLTSVSDVNFVNNILISQINMWETLWKLLNVNPKDKSFHNSIDMRRLYLQMYNTPWSGKTFQIYSI